MELMRIVAMILVMVVHAGFVSIGIPSTNDVDSHLIISFFRFLLQSFSIVCVNLFILLSGWFGIRPKKIRFLELLFQVSFFLLIGLIISVLLSFTGYVPKLSIKKIITGLTLFYPGSYWFVQSYVLLYVLTPILNEFINHSTIKTQKRTLISFFLFQFVCGWLTSGVEWFSMGYSTISFIGLYLLASYIHMSVKIIQNKWLNMSAKHYLLIYIILSILNSLVATIFVDKSFIIERLFFYNSPFVILSSLSLFLFFSKLSLKKKFINWIAVSCFSIYLLHCNPFIFKFVYTKFIHDYFLNHAFLQWCCTVLLFIFFTFLVSIMIDKIRIRLWTLLIRKSN